MTEPQAQVITAALGFLSVILGAVLAPIVFFVLTRKGVTNFDEAIKKVTESAGLVKSRTDEIVSDLSNLKDTTLQINDFLAVIQRGNALVQARQEETAETQPEAEAVAATPISDDEQERKDQMRSLWGELQGLLEDFAADPDIDARTRAKYARIDRRNYEELANALAMDGSLPGRLDQWKSAIDLWNVSKRNGHRVSQEAVDKFRREVENIKITQLSFNASNEHLADTVRNDACNGTIATPLTFDVLRRRYHQYEDSYLRTLLPNYAEGGYANKRGEPARFRRIAVGQYEPICSEAQK